MSLSLATKLEVARFLRSDVSHVCFVSLATDWLVATDALEEAGLVHHAQQIRSLIELGRLGTVRGWAFDEHRPLRELAEEAAHTLVTGEAPRVLWGDARRQEDDTIAFDSIYVRGFPSLRVELGEGGRQLVSGETLETFRTVYLGHRYSGRSRDSFLVVHRGAKLARATGRRRM